MNRTIKFRGLRTDGKGWVYGVPYYISGERKCFIIDNCQSGKLTQEDSIFQGKEVEYKSVGQFTGLKDKNGVKIFEGDIESGGGVVKLGIYEMYSDRSGFPTWIAERKNGASFVLVCDNEFKIRETIIGNIHEKNRNKMKTIKDKNGTPIMPGDVIDINETVNGYSIFFIKDTDPLDIRYNYDRERVYEYDMHDLLKPCRFSGESEFEILNPF